MKATKTKAVRTFHFEAPEEMLPLYLVLQEAENVLLSNPITRNILIHKIDYHQHKGNVWRAMRDKLQPIVTELLTKPSKITGGPVISNVAWYSYILYENLRRLYLSLEEAQNIFDLLEYHNFETTSEFWEMFFWQGLSSSIFRIENLARCKRRPTLPEYSVFVLDYSISEKQIFELSEKTDAFYECKIKTSPIEWIELKVAIPFSCRENATGELSRPRFRISSKDGKLIGDISYGVKKEPLKKNATSICGVDIGKVYPYILTILREDGVAEATIAPTKLLLDKARKLDRLIEEKANLVDIQLKEQPRVSSENPIETTLNKYLNRNENILSLSQKIMNIKEEIAWLSATEIVKEATKYNCKEIHIENLSWLHSKGGKWNHSRMFQRIIEIAELYSLEVVKVNARNSSREHPITGEAGKFVNRDVVFSNGQRIDRDRLASTNLAKRNTKDKEPVKVTKLNKAPLKRAKPKSRRKVKRQVLQDFLKTTPAKEGTKIVVFSRAVLKGRKSNHSLTGTCLVFLQDKARMLSKQHILLPRAMLPEYLELLL